MAAAKRESGTCVFWDLTYGFIAPDAVGAKDVFVHHSAVEADGHRELSQGQRVSFGRGREPNGERECAIAVRLERERL